MKEVARGQAALKDGFDHLEPQLVDQIKVEADVRSRCVCWAHMHISPSRRPYLTVLTPPPPKNRLLKCDAYAAFRSQLHDLLDQVKAIKAAFNPRQ